MESFCWVRYPKTGSFSLALDHDPIGLKRIMISSYCLSMIFSENRFPLFRVML